MLRHRIRVWYDVEQRLLPAVADLRAQSTYDIRSASPEHLRLLLPSVIARSSTVPNIFLEREWRLREGQAYDALADLRRHLEVLEYLNNRDCSSTDTSAYALRLGAAISTIKAEQRIVVCRYREAYSALRTLAQILHKTDWKASLSALRDDDIMYVTAQNASGRPSWIWTLGGTAQLSTDDLLDIHLNKGLSQGTIFTSSYTDWTYTTLQHCESHGASLALKC